MTDAELDKLDPTGPPLDCGHDEPIRRLVAEVRRLRAEVDRESGDRLKERHVMALWLDEASRALRRECPGHPNDEDGERDDLDYHYRCGDDCLRLSFLATVNDARARLEKGVERLRLAERLAEALNACGTMTVPDGREYIVLDDAAELALEAWRLAR